MKLKRQLKNELNSFEKGEPNSESGNYYQKIEDPSTGKKNNDSWRKTRRKKRQKRSSSRKVDTKSVFLSNG